MAYDPNQMLGNPWLNFGMGMLGASAPSTNPQSGSMAYALSQGLGSMQKGNLAAIETQRSQEYLKAMQLAMQRKAQEAGDDPAAIAEAMAKFDHRNQYSLLQPGDKPSLAGRMPRQPNWWELY